MQKKTKKNIEQQKRNFVLIKQFLLKNADPIQKEATNLHKLYLGSRSLRTEFIAKYQNNHITIVQEIARHLEQKDLETGAERFEKLGEQFAKESVRDGLTVEEAIDGTIFLKQAIWKDIEKEGFLRTLSVDEFYKLSQLIGTYIDVCTSKIAFTYYGERLAIENNLRFLADASRLLASSLDYQTTLNAIATLAVPQIADWCAIDMLDKDGKIQQVAIAHKDPRKVKWAKELRARQPINMDAPTGVPNVLRTGKSELYPIITDEMLVATARNKTELKLTRSIGFTSAMIVPIFAQNKPVGAITFVTTETERHFGQADLVMAEELANRASSAIENANLFKGSQEAITLRDDFISVASHELKTPVTSVKMFTQVLKKHSEQIGDIRAVGHLTKMDKQLNKLTELIYDLLNVSKIQAGKMAFKETYFPFDTAVRDIVDILQQSYDTHRLIIQGQTNKKIYGDEERIGQVVNNLISNAIKYSPKSDKILIKLSSDSHEVQVAIQDFGIGMETQHLARIFERFYRVYDTTDKTFPGLGIGLYISSEIIKRHGGKFWVKSDIGKGSTFYFTIPVKQKIKTAKRL